MFINSDFSELLRIFNDSGVRYLVIGGYAVIQHSEPRFTKDLDIWIATDLDNAKAVYKALKEFGAPLENLTERDFSEEGYFYQMGNPPVRVDVMMGVPGVKFEDAWIRQVEFTFGELQVRFISKADLITAKLASARPQDLMDVENLGGVIKRKKVISKRKQK